MLVETITDPIIAFDQDGKIGQWNAAAVKVFGYGQGEAIGASLFHLVIEETCRERFRQEINGFATNAQPKPIRRPVEITGKTKSGGGLPMEVATSAIRSARNQWAFISVFRDISERHAATAKLFALNESLERRVEERTQAVRESEFRWHFAIEGSFDGLWDWNVPAGTVFFSPRWKAMLGFADDEIGDRLEEWSKRVHPDDLARVMAEVQAHLAGTSPFYASEHRVSCKDGSWKWIIDRGMVVSRDAAGKALRVIGTHRDITERKQAEVALQTSEREFRTLAEAMPQIVWITRADGWTIYFNQQWVDYTGLKMEESYGDGWIKPFHQDDQPRAWAAWQNATQNHSNYSVECRLRKADGSYRWWLIRGSPLRDAGGNILKWVGTCTDIEDIKQVQEALRESRAKLDAALASMTDAVFISDNKGRFIQFNNAFATFHKFRNTEECAQTLAEYSAFLDVFLPDGELAPMDMWAVPRALRGEVVTNAEYALRRKDTGETWVGSYSFSPILDEAGVIVGSVVVGRDITERKSAEAEIRELNRTLEQRVQERTAELRAANQELEAFAYAVSHDLRAPLRAINGFSRALLEDHGPTLPGDACSHLDEIILASRRMGVLIDGLLRLARSTRGELHLDAVNLSALASRILGELVAAEPNRRVTWTVEPGMNAQGDESMIEGVLANLLDNAWKYTANTPEPRIEVGVMRKAEDSGAAPSQHSLVFFVRDNGAGFDMKHAARLFQPFQRLHREDEFPGIGIGLATVQRIVHRHGGTIRASAAPGLGATFVFCLPPSAANDEKTP